MNPLSQNEFFRFVKERESIRRAKESGASPPWTDDTVLQDFYFCNIYREDDKTTRWFRENVRNHLFDNPRVITSTIAFRWFNKIETGELLLDLLRNGWDRAEAEERLRNVQQSGGVIFGSAYIIKSPPGMDKVTGILECIDRAVEFESRIAQICTEENSLQAVHEVVAAIPYQGRFTAYEVVTDLRHTGWLWEAQDIMTWASAGPGCARGLGWLTGTTLNYQTDAGQEELLAQMAMFLEFSRHRLPRSWRKWEMREVEHSLCEFDKYCRAVYEGKRLKRRYHYDRH